MHITKPIDDYNDYNIITLKNGIDVILTSSNKVINTFVSVTINVGYYQDTIPGIAHFLEHMLFMGTKNYPEENYFQKFIFDNGGHANAFTINEYTSYYYDISNDLFGKSMAIFSDFFINPIFKEDAINREINAIDGEHNKNLNNSSWRLNALLKEISGSNKFGTGNSTTLNIPNISSYLKTFFDKYYSANLIKISILSSLDINSIKLQLDQTFAKIPNKNITLPAPIPIKFPKNKIVYYNAVNLHDKTCNICWSIKIKDTPILNYLLYIINNPEGLAGISDIECYYNDSDSESKIFTIEIHFFDDISTLTLVQDYMTNIFPQIFINKKYFDEFIKIMNINFQYKIINDFSDFNSIINLNMFKYNDILKDSYMTEYSRDFLQYILDQLSFDKSIILISDDKKHTGLEKWYNIEYEILNRSKDKIKYEHLKKFTKPNFNDLIPNKFDIYSNNISKMQYDDNNKLWKRAYNNTRILIMICVFRINESINTKLLEIIITHRLKLISYYIGAYGCNIELISTTYGMQLIIKSYPDIFKNILDTFLNILNTSINDSEIIYAKKILTEEFDQHEFNDTTTLLYELLTQSFLDNICDINYFKSKINEFNNIKLTEYPKEILIEGNFNESILKIINDSFENIKNERINNEIFYLDKSTSMITVQNYYNDINSGILVFYELPISNDLLSTAKALLCETILKQAFFTQLRTTEQLGYIIKVHFIYEILNGNILPGICFMVISAKNNLLHIRNRIKTFIKNFNITVDSFNEYKMGLLNILSKIDDNVVNNINDNALLLLTNSYNMNGQYIFDMDLILKKHVSNITYDELISFYNCNFINKTKKVRIFQINRKY